MAREKTLKEQNEAHDIRVPKALADANLHDRLERLAAKIHHKEKRKLTKPELVVELLDTHPQMKSL